MNENPRTFRERAGLATSTSHLRQDDNNRTDLDYVLAMGIAAVRNNAAALPLLRLHLAATGADYEAARLYAINVAAKLRNHNKWDNGRGRPIPFAAVCHIAEVALAHHICPVCPHCHGRKFKIIPGTPNLSTTICPHCRGDGRRQVQAQYREYIEATLVQLELLDNKTEATVKELMQ